MTEEQEKTLLARVDGLSRQISQLTDLVASLERRLGLQNPRLFDTYPRRDQPPPHPSHWPTTICQKNGDAAG
jgi:hypothetical protein